MITFASVSCSILVLLLLLAFTTPAVDAGRIRGRRAQNGDDRHRRGEERLFNVGKSKKGSNFGFDTGPKGIFGDSKKGTGFNLDLNGGPKHKGSVGCFHGSARVQMENGMTEAMEEVQVGDRIMSVDDNGQRNLVDVVYVPHLHNEVRETFMKVSCRVASSEKQGTEDETEDDVVTEKDYEVVQDDYDSTTTLLITPGHFVFASMSIDVPFEYSIPISAEELMHVEKEPENTPVWLWITAGETNDRVEPCEVISLDTVEETGIYSLFTSNGRMIVDGLVVSNYAASSSGWINYDHSVAHRAAALHRFMYAMGMGSTACFRTLNDYVLSPLFA